MPKPERFSTGAVAFLKSAITNVQTTLEVSDPSLFPTDGNFRIAVGTEIMLVTAVSGDTLTITRGVESTSGQAHDGGARVVQALTAGALQQLTLETLPLVRDTARPLMNTIVNDAGTILDSTDFTWDNQGSATVTDLSSGGMQLAAPTGAGDSLRVLYKTINTAPNKLTVGFVPLQNNDSVSHVGIGFRESDTGKLITISTANVDELAVYKWTNSTTFSSQLFTRQAWPMARNLQWFQIEDNNTNVIFRTGMDGINWQTIASEARTTFMASAGPNQVCFYANSNSASFTSGITVVAWEEE